VAGFAVELKRSAQKEFRRLPRTVMVRFGQAIEELAEGPLRPRAGLDIRKLHGTRSTWRLRVGEYRGIFEAQKDRLVFTRFAHRSKVYDA
jgi:mRNA interferase RelE/StbE